MNMFNPNIPIKKDTPTSRRGLKAMLRSKSFRASSLASIALALLVQAPREASAQSAYTWNSAVTSGTWNVAGDWLSTSGTGFPGGNAGDTVTFGDATSNQLVNFANISETIASMTFNQTTTTATDKIQLSSTGSVTSLTVTNALMLGGDGSGPVRLYIDGYDSIGKNPTFTDNAGITIGSNGTLEISSSGTQNGMVTGSIQIGNGGVLNIDRSGTSTGWGGVNTITGNVSLDSGGAINLSSTNSGTGAAATGGDTRFSVNGNLVTTGGTIALADTTPTSEIYLTGSSASATFGAGTTISTNSKFSIIWSGTAVGSNAFTLQSDVALPMFKIGPGATTTGTVNVNVGTITAGQTLSMAGLTFSNPTISGSGHSGISELTLTSNLALGSAGIGVSGQAIGASIILNMNGYTLDYTSAGLFKTLSNGGSLISWSIQGGGTIKAGAFNLANNNYYSAVGANTTLQATSASLANNLSSGTTSGGPNAIDPTSVFLYTGTGASQTATLSATNRSIGRLVVGDGSHASTLALASNITGGSDVAVQNSGTLNLAGFNLTQSSGAGAVTGGLNGGGVVLNGSNGTTSTVTVDTTGGNGNFSGSLTDHATGGTGIVALIKAGTGTQTLSNGSSYSGGTTINNGTLNVTNSTGSATGTGIVTITATNAAGSALLTGNGIITGAVTTTGASGSVGVAHIAPGNAGVGTLTLSGGLTIGAGTNLDYTLGSSSSLLSLGSGGLDLTSGSNVVLNVTSGSGYGFGTYDLINFTGALSGSSNLASWSVSGAPAGTTNTSFAMVTVGGTNEIQVTFSGVSSGNNSVIGVAPASINFGRVMISSSPTITGTVNLQSGTSATGYTIAGSGAASPATYSSANGAVTSGSSSTFTAGLSTSTSGVQSGTLAIQNTGNDGTGSSSAGAGQGNAQSPVNVTVSGTVVQNRVITSNTVNLGNVLANVTTGVQTGTLSTTGADTDYTRVTLNGSSANSGGVTVGSGTSALFNDPSVSTTRSVSGNFSSSGTKSGSVGLSVTGEGLAGESVNPVNVGYTANVFMAAASSSDFTTGTSAGANGSVNLLLSLTAPSDGGQKAAATINSLSSANPNFQLTTTGSSTGIATGSNSTTPVVAGNVSVAPDRLNGNYTFTGDVTGTAAYSDPTLQTGGATPYNPTWSGVSITVSINNATSSGSSQAKSAYVATGGSYNLTGAATSGTSNPILTSGVAGGFGTTAYILAGTASGNATISGYFSATNGHPDNPFRRSDTFTLTGVQQLADQSQSHDGSVLTDTFVLQLSYTSGGPGTPSYYIGWYDAQMGQWVNAIAGNSNAVLPRDYSGGSLTSGSWVLGEEFVGSYQQFLADNANQGTYGSATDLAWQLGAYGYDSTTGVAWSVVDHNSDFAVIPEPNTWGMVILGFGMLIGIQRLRKHRVGI